MRYYQSFSHIALWFSYSKIKRQFMKMTDSMKFGPEWLRNLSQDGCTQPSVTPTPRYQLAEHRYGREEMLALFDRLVKAPDTLVTIPSLYVEKTQPPLALLQMTEEETRMWNRGINSDAVLRLSLKTPAGMPSGTRGGRGGSVDRGRGRGRGSYHYARGLSYEEPGDGDARGGRGGPDRGEGGSGPAAISFNRAIRSYDRSQGSGVERGWSERNGADPGDWNGSTSPRKEFGGRGFMSENWRRHRGGGEDEDGWRTATGGRSDKWGGRPTSWREGDKDGIEPDRRRNPGWERGRAWDNGAPPPHHPHRRPWDEDNLPEWAMENPSESGGSFDASGAFHGGGGFSDDEEHTLQDGVTSTGRPQRVRLLSEGNSGKRPPPNRRPGVLSRDPGLSRSTEEEPTRSTEDSSTDRLASGVGPPHITSATTTKKSPPPISSDVKKSPGTPVQSSQSSDVNCEPDSRHEPVPIPTSVSSVVPQLMNSSAASGKRNATNGITRNVSTEVLMTVPTTATTSLITNNSVNIRFPVPSGVVANQTLVGGARRQKSEDDMERMQEVADDLVAKLMDDEESQEKMTDVPGSTEKWFYQDPQGEVQGPFSSNEMAEWFRSGYFTLTLLVRRGCDERYSQLGDLIKNWGRIPFMHGPTMPSLKAAEPVSTSAPTVVQPTLTQGVPAGLTQDSLLVQQYQYHMLQRQLQLRQAAVVQAAMGKLSQSEHWSSMSQLEQQQLIIQQMAQQPVDPSLNPFIQPKNPVLQLLNHIQQQSKVSTPVVPDPKLPPSAVPAPQLDPLQQLIREMGGLQQPLGVQSMPPAAPATSLGIQNLIHATVKTPTPSDKVDDPIQSLLRQLGNKVLKPQVDSVWGGSVAPAFNAQSWLQQMGQVPAAPPGQLPTSLWDLHGKDMKTEQQILEEQMRAEEERRREEQRKQQEEAKRQEELEKRKQLEEELRKKEAEKKRLEEHMQRMEEERQRQEEEQQRRQAEELKQKQKQAEEERKRQEEAKRLEEEQRKKEEVAKRKEEEKKRKEEERERKKKLEEERKREEKEKKRQEEEQARKKQEEEEQVRRLEQQRRQTEALRRLQEQQQRAKAAPWSQQAAVPPTGGNLADIQRQEKEKKEREAREQQQVLLQLQQQQQQQQQQQLLNNIESNNRNNGNGIQLKWAEKKPSAASKVKSLSEIQAEEQEQLVKQQERERAERAQQQKEVALPSCASIWGAAAQSLSWATAATGANSATTPAWGGAGTGGGSSNSYWEDVPPATQKPTTKIAAAKTKAPVSGITSGKGGSKTRSKKEEAQVLKLFEQNTQRGNEFVQWCTRALGGLQASVDIPTFVLFLQDIDSPYEVKDYVRLYLGESKEALEFARQFLERRSKWRSAQRAVPLEDDMCVPAPAVNPLNTDFQEVKGKGKKAKKSKMLRLDNRILGFNVTAAQDRINVGDRDYGEGI